MAGNVGQPFHRDPVASHLDRSGQLWQLVGCLHDDLHAHLGRGVSVGRRPEVRGLFAEGGDQAEFVEGGGSKVVDEPPDVGHAVLGVDQCLIQQPFGGGRVLVQQVAGRLDAEGDAGQGGSETVMQVAVEPAAFLLTGRH